MHPRSRIRGGRDPPPPPSPSPSPSGGGRYRRRSPPSPRHHHNRRARESPPQRRVPERQPPPPPPPLQRCSPERLPPRRLLMDDNKPPPLAVGGGDRSWRDNVLLEAGRLATHYLVAQGLLPEHVLHARGQDPSPKYNHNPSPRSPAPKHPDDDPRWPHRNGGGGGGGGDKREEDERLARARSGWDRRAQSFDGRRNNRYNDGGAPAPAPAPGGGGGGEWGRDKDGDRGGGRRANVYDDKRWPAMSRSYSQNDRRASSNDRRPSADDMRLSVDRRPDRRRRSRSRSRSRSRTRPRNSYGGSRRDSDWRARNGDLDQSRVLPEQNTTVAGGNVDHRDDADTALMKPKGPRSMVLVKADDGASHEYEEVVVMEAEDGTIHEYEEGMVSDDGASYEYEEVVESEEDEEMVESVDRGQDVGRDEDGEAAAAGLNDAAEINASHQPSIVDVHAAEEPVNMQSQLCDVEEDGEAGIESRDACPIEPAAENSGLSEARGEMEAPQTELETEPVEKAPQIELETELHGKNELETDAGDPNRDEELPAWFGIFDLSVTGAHESCEISEIPGDPPEDHVVDPLPDFVGQTSQQAYSDTVETQGAEEPADDNQQFEVDGQVLNQDIGTHDSNENDLNSEQMHIDQRADEHGPGDEQSEDEQMLVNNEETLLEQDAEEHVDHTHLIENEQMLVNDEETHLEQDVEEHVDHNHLIENDQTLEIDEETLLKQDAEEHVDQNHQVENEQMLLNEGTAVQVLDNHQENGEQLLPDHATDEHPDVNHQTKNEQMLLDHVTVTGVHDLDHGDLNGEQMLQNIGANKPGADAGLLKDGQLHLDQAADGQATFHILGNGQTVPVINLEDDDEEQSDTGAFLDPK